MLTSKAVLNISLRTTLGDTYVGMNIGLESWTA